MSKELDYKEYGKGFAEEYIKDRITGSYSDGEIPRAAAMYILYITELLCLLTKDSPLTDKFMRDFVSFLVEIEEECLPIPYDYIAFFVYNNPINYDFSRITVSFVEIVDTSILPEFTNHAKMLDTISGKIKRHIQLAIYQKEFIVEGLEYANEKVGEIEGKAIKVEEQTKSLLQDVYSSFITILGIFSAIIVAAFGGISIVSTSLSKLDNTYSYTLFLSTGILSLLLIMYYLFVWVDQLRRPIGEKVGWGKWYFLAVTIILSIIAGVSMYNKPTGKEPAVNESIKTEQIEPVKYDSGELEIRKNAEINIKNFTPDKEAK